MPFIILSKLVNAGPYMLTRRCASRNLATSCRLWTEKTNSIALKARKEEEASAIKDIILFKYEKPRFFKYLNLFAIAQYGFWVCISFTGMSMIDIPVPVADETSKTEKDEEEKPFWRTMNLGSDKYKYGLTIGSLTMGFSILFLSWMYILRSVRYVVLRRDGKTVAFVTYAPFGRNRIMNVPVKNISAVGSRTSGATQMPVKVRGKILYYMLDLKEGKFTNSQLFDRTVGTKRKFF